MRNQAAKDTSELEAIEQREWRESLEYVIQQGDRGRVQAMALPGDRGDGGRVRGKGVADLDHEPVREA